MLCFRYWIIELTTACSIGRAQISFRSNQISDVVLCVLDTVIMQNIYKKQKYFVKKSYQERQIFHMYAGVL